MSAINDLIDRMTEAEYLSMVDMKWVADRLREFAVEEAHKPKASPSVDWNKFVKALGDYHGIECYPVETMEEADAQLAELYAKERHTPQEEKPAVFDWCKLEGNVCQYCKSYTHKCPNRSEVTFHDIAMKIRELQKPPANADMVEDEFEKWLKTMSEKASYSDQRELLRVVLKHYKESHPVKAPADEGLVVALEIIRSGGTVHLEKYSKLGREDMMKIAEDFLARHKASDKEVEK